MARINICTNLTNGIGLQVEYEMLRAFLEARGHHVNGIQWDEPLGDQPTADLQIWLEVVVPGLMPLAPEHWLFVNPEWLRNDALNEVRKSHFTKVLCKTRDAERTMEELTGKAYYVGFLTRDHNDPLVPRERKFLHIGGNGGYRNTQQVVDAWGSYQYWASFPGHLTVISKRVNENIPNVTCIDRVSDEELKRLQNSHLYHLYPSAYEGFGHALHEGLGCGAIVMTTDADPMSDFGCPFVVPSTGTYNHGQAQIHEVTAMDIRSIAKQMFELSQAQAVRLSAQARQTFEAGNKEFDTLFEKQLEDIGKGYKASPIVEKKTTAQVQKNITVAILGNHLVSFCTERELDWTFEHLGHTVVRFQEGTITAEGMLTRCLESGVNLFLYVHTHGYQVAGDISMEELILRLKSHGIRTASFHLDLYWGLGVNDKREQQIGQIAFWKTDYVFTADGGHQKEFAERGVNHIWLPPAVVERGCHWGVPQEKYRADVGFIGSKSYHPEYPWRPKLIKFLEKTYGNSFKRFNGDTPTGQVREKDLNDAYASIKIAVGDCCFAGTPMYWSDRVNETMGRGGFLIHPDVPGLRIPGLVTFKTGDLDDLKDKIDYYLEHENKRLELQKRGFEYIRQYGTYTNRVIEMLEILEMSPRTPKAAYVPDSTPEGSVAVVWHRGKMLCADMAMINETLEKLPWPLVHHEVFPEGLKGAVVIIPARQCLDDINLLNRKLAKLEWVLLLAPGDEENVFPIAEIQHPNMLVWTMSPLRDNPLYQAPRFLINGSQPKLHETLWSLSSPIKERDWFFAGQVTHPRRFQCVEQLERLPNGYLYKTQGFMQGMNAEAYYANMQSAKIIPCPSGPIELSTARIFEAIECGCVPVVDGNTPRGIEPGYWEWFFGETPPFPIIYDWTDFPRILEEELAKWPDNQKKIKTWWEEYKRKFREAIEKDIRELKA